MTCKTEFFFLSRSIDRLILVGSRRAAASEQPGITTDLDGSISYCRLIMADRTARTEREWAGRDTTGCRVGPNAEPCKSTRFDLL